MSDVRITSRGWRRVVPQTTSENVNIADLKFLCSFAKGKELANAIHR